MNAPSTCALARIERWRRLASQTVADRARSYEYPSTDHCVDEAILQQDAQKTNREFELLRREINGYWRVAVDFGAGLGRSLPLFDLATDGPRVLIAVEPDPARAAAAATVAQSLHHVEGFACQGDVARLASWPAAEVDLVTCVQVLGHVRSAELVEIIAGLHRLLRPKGKLVLCIPTVGPMFVGQPGAGEWSPPADFYHVVNLRRSPFAVHFRVPVTADAHELLAGAGGGGLLPVRSFFQAQWPTSTTAQLPFAAQAIPASLVEIIAPRFEVLTSLLYSIHRLAPDNDAACIGDQLLVLRKR